MRQYRCETCQTQWDENECWGNYCNCGGHFVALPLEVGDKKRKEKFPITEDEILDFEENFQKRSGYLLT